MAKEASGKGLDPGGTDAWVQMALGMEVSWELVLEALKWKFTGG